MSAPMVFVRPPGSGWLVLAGAFDPTSWRGLPGKLARAGSVYCLVPSAANLLAERDRIGVLEEQVGAGVEVGVIDKVPLAELAEARAAVLAGGRGEAWLKAFGSSVGEEGLLRCIDAGGLVVAAGGAASALGSWAWDETEGQIAAGLGWLGGAIVLAVEVGQSGREAVRRILSRRDRMYMLSLPPDGGLALGPEGEVEVWGAETPKVTLGRGWG